MNIVIRPGSINHTNFRRLIHITLLLLFLHLTVLQQIIQAQFAGGDGTKENPYQITNWFGLDTLRYFTNTAGKGKFLQLMNDLDSTTEGYDIMVRDSNGTLVNDGMGWSPLCVSSSAVYGFSGNLDGKGYHVNDLQFNHNQFTYAGLFGIISENGTIKDLAVERATIKSLYSSGGLAGANSGTIINSSFSGTVSGNSNIGLLTGINRGLISNCYTCGVVGSISTNPQWIGGLVGLNDKNGIVSNCYAKANVSGFAYTGGLIGLDRGNIEYCYCTGTVSGTIYIGSLIGSSGGKYTSCFCDGPPAVGSTTTPDGIFVKTPEELKVRSTFTDWDFTLVWDIKTGDSISFPFLRTVPQEPPPGISKNNTRIILKSNLQRIPARLYAYKSGPILRLSNSFPHDTFFTLFDFYGRKIVSGALEGDVCTVGTLAKSSYILKIGENGNRCLITIVGK
jgi:hypothetical protein